MLEVPTTPRTLIIVGVVVLSLPILAYSLYGALRDRREGESVDRTAERAGDRVQEVSGGILSTMRVFVVVLLGIVVQFMGELAQLGGEVWGGLVTEAPVLASSFVVTGLGYFGLSGQLAVTASSFLVGALIVVGLGVVIEYA
ncbi:hypothetical protein [Halorhabdus amylolytica]|uniref:hypothetical protein n=1 Tax=Halorhabdus amylolytica TaxID=2559573 RepID=UPI0010AA5BF0|nr:hypothetical protein [Halorhabdus amylolytica]